MSDEHITHDPKAPQAEREPQVGQTKDISKPQNEFLPHGLGTLPGFGPLSLQKSYWAHDNQGHFAINCKLVRRNYQHLIEKYGIQTGPLQQSHDDFKKAEIILKAHWNNAVEQIHKLMEPFVKQGKLVFDEGYSTKYHSNYVDSGLTLHFNIPLPPFDVQSFVSGKYTKHKPETLEIYYDKVTRLRERVEREISDRLEELNQHYATDHSAPHSTVETGIIDAKFVTGIRPPTAEEEWIYKQVKLAAKRIQGHDGDVPGEMYRALKDAVEKAIAFGRQSITGKEHTEPSR